MDPHLADTLLGKKKALVSKFLKTPHFDVMNRHVHIMDDYFRGHFEKSLIGQHLYSTQNPFSILALGGYGRGEQNLHSDIDLLFLFGKKVPENANQLIQEIIYPLWDVGFDISPATRSLKECIDLASKDYDILTPLLDARFICGESSIYSDLKRQVRRKIIVSKANDIIEWLVSKNMKRHRQFGDSSYLLEPNLKEGQGGLRDYHMLLWTARIRSNLQQRRDLEYFGYVSHEEFLALNRALQFIWTVRNWLHHLSGRKSDRLFMEYQQSIAEKLLYHKKNGQEPVERFLGELHGHMRLLKELHFTVFSELGFFEKIGPRSKYTSRSRKCGLEVKNGMFNFSSSKQIPQSPDLIAHIFKESACRKFPLSAESKRLIREFGYLVDHVFRSSPSMVKIFEKILVDSEPDSNVLDDMLSTGFLVRFIPEMAGIVNRIQYNEYHIYPVDRHSLQTVQTIKRFGAFESKNITSDPLFRSLYAELGKNQKTLLWAALLHDIGKSKPGSGHSKKGAKIVRKILLQKGFKEKDIDTISFLVAEHLLLIKTATRRDLLDEQTAIICARKIRDIDRLKMLYLLTVADSISTGPKAWNEWTGILLRDLFFKILRILEKGELATREAVASVAKKKDQILSSVSARHDKGMIESMFHVMSPRYLLYVPSDDIPAHMALYHRLKNHDIVLDIEHTKGSDVRKLTVCAKDRPGLFSKISGVLTLNNINILDAQIYTWRNHIALDIFEVTPPPDRLFEKQRWSKVESNLAAALNGSLDLSTALSQKKSSVPAHKSYMMRKPHEIIVDNETSSFFTIIEVITYDFPGLLFKVTDALFCCGLDIRIAKIATKVDQVLDVFYVRDLDGQRVDLPDQVAAVKKAILNVLPRHI